VSDYFQKPKEE